MTEVKEIEIVDWSNRKVIEFLKSNKEIVLLIQEENSFYIIPQIDLVIEDWSSRTTRGTCRCSIKELIKRFEDE